MYRIEIRHDGLNKYKVIVGRDKRIVEEKARVHVEGWNRQWAQKAERKGYFSTKDQRKAEASKLTEDYNAVVLELKQILLRALERKNRFEWNSLKSGKIFDKAIPAQPVAPKFPPEPNPFKYDYVKFGFLDKIIPSRRRKLEQEKRQA